MAATKQERQLRRKAVLRILMDDKTGPMKDQKALVKILKSIGIPATQASVSRDLRELGAVWVEGHYEIPVWNDDAENPLQKVLGFIVGARVVADHFIFVTTQRGAGGIVAEALEACLAKDILGTSAGEKSVLVLTKDKSHQERVWSRLEDYFEPADEEEEPSPANGATEPGRDAT